MRQYLIFLLGISSVLYGQHKKRPGNREPTLFSMGSYAVSVDEFNYAYRKACRNHEAETTEQGWLEYLDEFMTFKLKIVEAKKLKLDTISSFRNEYITYRRNLQQPYLPEGLDLRNVVDEAYSRMRETLKISYILIKVNPHAPPEDTLVAFHKIQDIKKKLDQGEDFAQLAKNFSEDPRAKDNGGRIGYFSALHMVLPFEEAAYRLKVNEISPPVRTQFGYNLIKLEDRQPVQGKIEVSHIFIKGHERAAKTKIDEVYKQLQQGVAWDTLSRIYSEDDKRKNKGGRIAPFGRGDFLQAPIFEEAAFDIAVPGTFTTPIKTAVGWHIIRLEKKIPLPPPQQLKRELIAKLKNSDRIRKVKYQARNRQKIRWNFKEYESVKKKMMGDIDARLTNYRERKNTVDQPLFQLKNTVFTTNEFLQYTVQAIHTFTFENKPSAYINTLYDRFVDEKLDDEEDHLLQAHNADYKNTLREYTEGALFFAVMKKKVWDSASKDAVGQQQYYHDHIEKYKTEEQVEALLWSTSDKNHRVSIEEKINKKMKLQSEDIASLDTVLPLKVYKKNDHKIIDTIDWIIGFHGVQTDTAYYVVNITRLLEAHTKKYDDAFGEVILDYQDYLEKKWVDELKEKYPIRVNDKNKRRLLQALRKQ